METLILSYAQNLVPSNKDLYKTVILKLLKDDNETIISLLLNNYESQSEYEKLINNITSIILKSSIRTQLPFSVKKSVISKTQINISVMKNISKFLSMSPMVNLNLEPIVYIFEQLPNTFAGYSTLYLTNYFITDEKNFLLQNRKFKILRSIDRCIRRLVFNKTNHEYIVALLPAYYTGKTYIGFTNPNYNSSTQPQRCCIFKMNSGGMQQQNDDGDDNESINLILNHLYNGVVLGNYFGYELSKSNPLTNSLTDKNIQWKVKVKNNYKDILFRNRNRIIKCIKPIFHDAQIGDDDNNFISKNFRQIINSMLLLNNVYDLYTLEHNYLVSNGNPTYTFVMKFNKWYIYTDITEDVYETLSINCLRDFTFYNVAAKFLIYDSFINNLTVLYRDLIYNFMFTGCESNKNFSITFFCEHKTLFQWSKIIKDESTKTIFAFRSRDEFDQYFVPNTVKFVYSIAENISLVSVVIPFTDSCIGYVFISPTGTIDWCDIERAIKSVTTIQSGNTSIILPPLSFRALLLQKKNAHISKIVDQLVRS